ncbi:MAG: DUF2062 domain-containing protein [Candidatus Omnitrophica bacterium]|nr:DUF2062 domain-containing protein [Candidatus Omnitrophota bacterium]MDD5591709.1 DUF2062 domain-containing protein [Candidatus Omnitrophota bacterium]
MEDRSWVNRISRFLKFIYIKLFRIHDTPQRIALGLGLGVFLGILPGTGPIAAICAALLFKVNRAASLLGSLLTNTWLSFVTFILSIKIGSGIMGLDWQKAHKDLIEFLKSFRAVDLLQVSTLKIIQSLLIGYFIVAFCLGALTYLITLTIIKKVKHENKSRINFSS